jgi:hypothetical protein
LIAVRTCSVRAYPLRYADRYRSVHNTRIERSWIEIERHVLKPWFERFDALELDADYPLDVTNPAHIWTLQYLFLGLIQHDLDNFRTARMNAPLSSMGGMSPNQLFFLRSHTTGVRSLSVSHEPDEPLSQVHINDDQPDWQQYGAASDPDDDIALRRRLDRDGNEAVLVDDPRCPFGDLPDVPGALTLYNSALADLQGSDVPRRWRWGISALFDVLGELE